ncbi:MAG: hypothetical protein HUK28_01400 [Methanobrevibacter sp.]|nr:hypothetical protein [Methanobrevibacter sp.]
MISRVQVLWYLDKDYFDNFCLDFKPYTNHQIEGYEVCDVDEDLIYDLCDKNPDKFDVLGYFKNKKEIENYLKNNGYDGIDTIEFDGEDFYLSVGLGEIGSSENKILSWYEPLKKEYKEDNFWVFSVTGYDPYELACTGKSLSYVLGDILNVNESNFDNLIPNKGYIEPEEWNGILDKIYKKYKFDLGLKRVV